MVDRDIEDLARLVQPARRAVVFTGAGMSTDCGIPDFRSPGGFWTRFKPIAFSEFLSSEEARLEAWRRFLMIHRSIAAARPGPGHEAVAELMRRGHVSCIVTQNIDGLHEAAAASSGRIIALHGNGTFAKCLECSARHEISWAEQAILETGRAPRCLSCGGPVKSASISFGQAMPAREMADARAATVNADLFIAIGSSLQVLPAAGFPMLAKQTGARLVILNREETALGGLADLVIRGDISPVMTALLTRLQNI